MNWDHKELKTTVKTSEILPFLGCQTRLVVPGAGAYLECLSEDHRSWGNVVMPLCSFSSMDLLCFIYFLLLRMHTFMLICQLIGVPKCVLSGTLTVFVVLAAKCSQKVYFVFISCALLYTCLPPSLPQIWNEVMCIVAEVPGGSSCLQGLSHLLPAADGWSDCDIWGKFMSLKNCRTIG